MNVLLKSEFMNELEIDFKEDEIVAIRGKNATGKTTLLKYISGLLVIHDGKIKYDDYNIFNFPMKFFDYVKWKRYIRKNIVYFESSDFLIEELSIKENISYFGKLMKINDQQVVNYLNELSINEKLNKKVKVLSKGSKQKLALAMILSSKKKYLFMDEPENNLDDESVETLYKIMLTKMVKDKTYILFASHKSISDLRLFKIYNLERNEKGVCANCV